MTKPRKYEGTPRVSRWHIRGEARMTKDEGMTKSGQQTLSRALTPIRRSRTFWGAHAPPRASFGALAEILVPPVSIVRGKVRDHEGVIAAREARALPYDAGAATKD